jgi:hypothetical protein
MPMSKSKRISINSQQNVNDKNDEDEKEKQPNEVPQNQKHLPKKMKYNIRGQIREYHFLKTVKSMEDLDKFRFKVRKAQKQMEQF